MVHPGAAGPDRADQRETADAVTVLIRPGWEWEGHRPGEYVRVGFQVNGRYHRRAYSITSDPGRQDGLIGITPKLLESGAVTPYVVREAKPGTLVRLGGVEGTFVLPEEVPARLLFVSAGSGITPIMSMLRSLDGDGRLRDVVHLHWARTEDDIIFGSQLRRLDECHDGYRLEKRSRASAAGWRRPTGMRCARTGASVRRSCAAPPSCWTR